MKAFPAKWSSKRRWTDIPSSLFLWWWWERTKQRKKSQHAVEYRPHFRPPKRINTAAVFVLPKLVFHAFPDFLSLPLIHGGLFLIIHYRESESYMFSLSNPPVKSWMDERFLRKQWSVFGGRQVLNLAPRLSPTDWPTLKPDTRRWLPFAI